MAKAARKTKRRPGASTTAAGGGQSVGRSSRAGGHRTAKTIRSLAKLMGRGASTVRKWTKRSDWPFREDMRSHPVDVEDVRVWAKIHLKPDPAAAYRKQIKEAEAGQGQFRTMSKQELAKTQMYIERALLLNLRRRKESGELHKTAECIKLHAELVHRAKAALLGMCRTIANSLSGETPDRIEEILYARVLAILEELEHGGE